MLEKYQLWNHPVACSSYAYVCDWIWLYGGVLMLVCVCVCEPVCLVVGWSITKKKTALKMQIS
jgi:hypothetical protein